VKKEPEERSFFSVFFRIVCISSLFWGAFFSAWGWQKMQHKRREQDERLTLKRLAARSTTVDKVPLSLLSSILEIQEGLPLFSLQPATLRDRIKACPAFSQARVWRLLPTTLGIEYTLRTPLASLGGVRNVVFDKTGTLFFLLPYFAPKKLPSVVFDLPRLPSLEEMQKEMTLSKEMTLAIHMLPALSSFADKHKLFLEKIDLSKRNHPNIFRREIIITFSPQLTKGGEYLYLRCHARSLSLKKMQKVFAYIFSSGFHPGVVDMRYSSCVLVSKEDPL
jgi:hypothetical protein